MNSLGFGLHTSQLSKLMPSLRMKELDSVVDNTFDCHLWSTFKSKPRRGRIVVTHPRLVVFPGVSRLKVIKLFSSSAQLSMKFQLLINVEIVKIRGKFKFKTQKQ